MDTTTFTSEDLAPRQIVQALGGAGFEVGSARKVRRTLLDTFDGRLYAAGLRLELREQSGRELILTGNGSPAARAATDGTPRLADELPAGPLRSRLAGVLEIRALMPVLTVSAREAVATKRDDDGKARVCVVVHDKVAVDGHDGSAVAGEWAAEVRPLVGYGQDEARARNLLAALGMQPADADVLDAAAARAGIDRRGFAMSPTVPLDPGEPALDAFRRVLANLAGAVDANWQGTVDDLDPEFLHDLRVAVRRTRSVLAQGKRVVPAQVGDPYREEFAWLGQETGRARDLDVYIIEWSDYVAPLDPDARTDLAPVLDHISAQRRAARAELADVLRSPRYQQLMSGWHEWLATTATTGGGKHAETAILTVATSRTTRAQDRLLRRGRAIDHKSPPEELHELRKDAKKLRYLLECFASLYDADLHKAYLKRLKSLQNNLGEHQDAEVHVQELEAMSRELHDTPGVGPETLLAMGQLTEQLRHRRRAARDEFTERFAAYSAKRTRRALRDLLRSAAKT